MHTPQQNTPRRMTKWCSSSRRRSEFPADLAADIRRVKGVKKHGMRIGNWLTAARGRRLLSIFDQASLRGKRDYNIGLEPAA